MIAAYSTAAREEKERRRLLRVAMTKMIDEYTVKPSSGVGGGIGWELIHDTGPTWYLRTEQEAIDAIPRHRARYV